MLALRKRIAKLESYNVALANESHDLQVKIERQQQVITGLEEWVSGIADTHNAIPDWIQQSARSLLAQQANKG